VKVGLACGGTGGHIFPGLATAEVLRAGGHEVTLWLAGKGVESAALPSWSGPVETVPAEGFVSGLSLRSLATGLKLLRAVRACTAAMDRNPPDVVLAMGSYACAGPVGAAMRLAVPFVLHESNVIPGRAISLFSHWAAAVACAFEETHYYARRTDLVLTGMPLRREIAAGAGAAAGRPAGRPFTVLVMGGSQGARALNTVVPEALAEAAARTGPLRVEHLAGRDDAERVRAAYAEARVDASVHAFVTDMAAAYGRADLAICRAGAATCAELCAFGVPAILVPLPGAIRGHQRMNAQAMARRGAADMVPESELTASWLAGYVQQALGDPGRLERMRAAARAHAIVDGAERLARLVEGVGAGHGRR
jgi:UDP-N-acetylglucosamine--N-acetylmuramyl-(pentapeptide) pyrophosphoryl-undecaprenol N-acetylglucosamine transferase